MCVMGWAYECFWCMCGCEQLEAGGCCLESSSIIIPPYSLKLYLSFKLRACLPIASYVALGIFLSLPTEAAVTGVLSAHPASVCVSGDPNSSSQICTASSLTIGHISSLKSSFLAWVLEDELGSFLLASKPWLSPQVYAHPSLYMIPNTFGAKWLVLNF